MWFLPLILAVLASFLWSVTSLPTTNSTSISRSERTTLCYGPGADGGEINWSDCATILHSHMQNLESDDNIIRSWSTRPGADRLLPESYTRGGCAIAISNKRPQGFQVGHWPLTAVNDAIRFILLDCGTAIEQEFGGERDIGEDSLDFFVRAYRPPRVEFGGQLGSDSRNVTEIS